MQEFFSGIGDSLYKLLIVENRWEMLLEGLGITLFIALISTILGTVLGLIVGSLPGLNDSITMAVLIPVTFGMSPQMALGLRGAGCLEPGFA